MEQHRELPLPDQLGQTIGGGHVAGRQRGEGGGVELLDLPRRGDLLAVLVDQEDGLGVGLLAQTAQSLLKVLELLLVKHEVCTHWLTFPDGAKIQHRGLAVKALISRQLSPAITAVQWNSRHPRRMSVSAR